MASLKKILLNRGFDLLHLERTATDHYALSGFLNGKIGRFLVDTGASNTCVGLERARGFGMQGEASEVKAAGAGALDMETQVSSDNILELGPWKRKGLPIVLFDMSHVNQALVAHDEIPVDGILGADILRQAMAVIDYGTDRLYLRKNAPDSVGSGTDR